MSMISRQTCLDNIRNFVYEQWHIFGNEQQFLLAWIFIFFKFRFVFSVNMGLLYFRNKVKAK